MPQAPSAQKLAERFRLRQLGRERGRDDRPSEQQPGLDNEEERVVDHCNQLFARAREEYAESRKHLDERLIAAKPADVQSRAADSEIDEACADMKRQFDDARPDLEESHQRAQQAIDDLSRFRHEENRRQDAQIPDRPLVLGAVIAVLLLAETFINGFFFGANVEGGLFAGVGYAALISVFNVGALGVALAFACRQMHHLDPRRRGLGVLLLLVLVAVAVVGNLFVAHYREAMSPDFPPQPDASAVEVAASPPGDAAASSAQADDDPSACWVGPDESDADQEALCLLRQDWLGLRGFQSWLLFAIGLAMCVGAAVDWFKMDDPYPGYGKRERLRRKTRKRLNDERFEVLDGLQDVHDDVIRRQRGDFVDPLDAWKRNERTSDGLRKEHELFCSFVQDLEASCRGALDIYRTANREARETPDPSYWRDTWESGWERSAPPAAAPSDGEAEAQRLGDEARAALARREARLRDCHERYERLVNDLAKLDPNSAHMAVEP